MQDSPEHDKDTRSIATIIREEIQKKIEKAQTDAAIKQKFLDEVNDEIDKVKQNSDIAIEAYTKGNLDKSRPEATQVLRTIIKTAEAAKNGLTTLPNPKGQELLIQLAKNIDVVQYATTIEASLGDYLFEGKEIIFSPSGATEKSDFEKAFDFLKKIDPNAADFVRKAMEAKAANLGTTSDVINSKFQVTPEDYANKIIKSPEEQLVSKLSGEGKGGASGEFERDSEQYYSYYFRSPEDLELLRALYSSKDFVDYIDRKSGKIPTETDEESKEVTNRKNTAKGEIETELLRKNSSPDEATKNNLIDDRLRENLSVEIEQRLVNMIDKLHVQLAREKASEPYEQIVNRDFFHGIGITIQTISRRIRTLQGELLSRERGSPDEKEKVKRTLYRNTQEEEEILPVEVEYTEKGQKKKTEKTLTVLKPLLEAKRVQLSEFALNLEIIINHTVHGRGYFHNANTIYNRPADPEHGFYAALANYAETNQGNDLDSILALPDGELVLEAFQLYDKLLDERFARQDWKSEPDQFSTKEGDIFTDLEYHGLLKALQMAHPDYDNDRLTSAMYMAKGLARGVFLNEPEKVAYADPPFTPSGGFTGVSYYTNDVSALMVFNPAHTPMRWQGENNLFPFLFIPLEDAKTGAFGSWDHNEIWQNMIKYRQSYWQGRGDLGGKQLLIDELVDFGKVGGPMRRRGWRTLFYAKDWFVWKKDNQGRILHKGKLPQSATPLFEVLPTWQNIEKLGWEVVNDFIMAERIDSDFLKKPTQDRTDFFKYLYKTYYIDQNVGFDTYMSRLKSQTRSELEENIRKNKVNPDSFEDQLELEMSNNFLKGVIPRYMIKTFPTKFIRYDRDRFHKEGDGNWKTIMKQLGWTPDKFDRAMNNLSLAEMLLRKEVSKNMKGKMKEIDADKSISKEDKLRKYGDALKDVDYYLTRDTAERLLKAQQKAGAQLEDSHIQEALDAFDKISEFIKNPETLSKYTKMLDDNNDKFRFYVYSTGLEQTDISLLLFRRAGPRVFARAIGDTGKMEMGLINHNLMKLNKIMMDMAIGEKRGDFSQLINAFQETFDAYESVHGWTQGYEAMEKLSAAVIAFFKKDTLAKGPLGTLLRGGKRNSIAAEIAGRSGAVWEWDATDIDKFVIALESHGLLKKDAFNLALPATMESTYINVASVLKKIPLIGRIPFEKVPGLNTSIKTFLKHRKIDYKYNGHNLRSKYGGHWPNIAADMLSNYIPLFIAFALWKFISESLKESEGKKK